MDVLERAMHEIDIFEKPSKETCLKMCEEIIRLRQLVLKTEAPNPMDPYTRIVFFFDEDQTAGSFLREDGDGGFTGAIYRMAREIDRLRQLLSEAEKREAEARAKLQAMHRRAQTAEGAFRGVMNVIDLWEPTLKFHKLSTHDLVMRSIKQDFERAVKKASALQSEER